jgi:hypothetical protein
MKAKFLVLSSLIFLSGFVGVRPCMAYISWDGGAGPGDTNWNTATNWNPDTVPGSADQAVLKATTGPVVTEPTPTISNISLGGNGGKGFLTVNGGSGSAG